MQDHSAGLPEQGYSWRNPSIRAKADFYDASPKRGTAEEGFCKAALGDSSWPIRSPGIFTEPDCC